MLKHSCLIAALCCSFSASITAEEAMNVESRLEAAKKIIEEEEAKNEELKEQLSEHEEEIAELRKRVKELEEEIGE